MSRAERLHAVACSIVRAVHHGRWHEKRVDAEARANALVRELAEAALDAADTTREPCSVPAVPPGPAGEWGRAVKRHPRRCLLCPRKAAPGSNVCTACYYQQYPKLEAVRVCPPRRRRKAKT